MKSSLKKNKEKNKKIILIVFLIIIVIVGISIFLIFNNKNKSKINELNNENYSFQYDNTWKIKKQESKEVELSHKKSDSKLNIKIVELQDDDKYKSLDEIFDSFLYNIRKQNEQYKLINKESSNMSKNHINGYKMLFENDNKQVEVSFYKQGNKLVVFSYEADSSYFDILLDSVNNIIYKFNLNNEKFDISSSINLETSEMTYTESEEVSNKLKDTQELQIASENYLVKYNIPDNFKATKYDTTSGAYQFQDISFINLYTYIYSSNLYEYLDKENTNNIYSNSINKDGILSKFKDEPLSYVYKSTDSNNEDIQIVYELNKNHIFVVQVKSMGIGIPEELINMIGIKEVKNIASNIVIEKEEGFLKGTLKRFTDSNYEKTEEINLKIPESYEEIDKGNNLYSQRNYALNYDDKKQNYQYEIKYEIINTTIEKELEILSQLGNTSFSAIQDLSINDKAFKVSERQYTISNDNVTYNVNEKVLFYDLQNGSYLMILIKENDVEITDEIMNQLVNFEVMAK